LYFQPAFQLDYRSRPPFEDIVRLIEDDILKHLEEDCCSSSDQETEILAALAPDEIKSLATSTSAAGPHSLVKNGRSATVPALLSRAGGDGEARKRTNAASVGCDDDDDDGTEVDDKENKAKKSNAGGDDVFGTPVKPGAEVASPSSSSSGKEKRERLRPARKRRGLTLLSSASVGPGDRRRYWTTPRHLSVALSKEDPHYRPRYATSSNQSLVENVFLIFDAVLTDPTSRALLTANRLFFIGLFSCFFEILSGFCQFLQYRM
jgi:hypothetical protein